MNDHTEAVLDYPLMRNALQAYTVTPMGKTLASQLHPHADATALDVQLRETSEMAATLAIGAEPPLAPVVDIRAYLEAAQIVGFYLEGGQFLDVAQCLEVLQRLRRYGQMESQRVPEGAGTAVIQVGRSEERRVGKECRSRWSPYH